jgi:uncharacterized damage-inducible protein DinB
MSTALPPWFERRFRFDFPAEHHAVVRVRLRGSPARLEELTRGLTPAQATERPGDTWSIQENAGHLLDLEALWTARVDDFVNGLERLTPADLTNRRTHEAQHNDRPLSVILAAFREARLRLVERLDSVSPTLFPRTSLHPRLNQPMRLVDHLYFVAEHDDHHLARIWELRRSR